MTAAYVAAVLTLYLDLPDTPLRPSALDQSLARKLHEQSAPLPLVESALLLATLRRFSCPRGRSTASVSIGRGVGSALVPVVLRKAVEAVPELLPSKPSGRQAPLRTQDGAVIPASHFGFGSGLADAVDDGQP